MQLEPCLGLPPCTGRIRGRASRDVAAVLRCHVATGARTGCAGGGFRKGFIGVKPLRTWKWRLGFTKRQVVRSSPFKRCGLGFSECIGVQPFAVKVQSI
jgi:hypothetical protein